MKTNFGFASKILLPIVAIAALAPAAMAQGAYQGGQGRDGYHQDFRGQGGDWNRNGYQQQGWNRNGFQQQNWNRDGNRPQVWHRDGYRDNRGYWFHDRFYSYAPGYWNTGVTVVVPADQQYCGPQGYYNEPAALQNEKNTYRNVAIGAGVIGVAGLINHNPTEAVLGLFGAAVAGSAYENDRHVQSEQQNGWQGNQNNRDYNGQGNGYHDGE